MDTQYIYYKERFISKLILLGFKIQDEGDNTFRLNLDEDGLKIITAKLIGSEPINERKHGTKNNTEIKSIGYFKFKLSPECIEPTFYIFAFSNISDNKVEFIIVPCNELRNRLNQRKCITDKDQETELKFWLLPPENDLFETTFLGAEGEWYFIAGRMAENTVLDYTKFLNGWGQLITFLLIFFFLSF